MNNQQAAGMMGMNPMMGDMSGMQMPMGMVGMQGIPGMGGEMGHYPPPMGNMQPQGGDMGDGGQMPMQDSYNHISNPQHSMGGGDYSNQVWCLGSCHRFQSFDDDNLLG